MAVTETPVTYRSHGREFKTKEAAERHDRLYTARQAAKDALRLYQSLLAESCMTADGQPFELGRWSPYWWIGGGIFSPPTLQRVEYNYHRWTVRGDSEDDVEISDDSKPEPRFVRISKLYADERAATKAWLDAKQRWVDELQADISTARLKAGMK